MNFPGTNYRLARLNRKSGNEKRSVGRWAERAFTLIELLVVIAIIGILAGLLIPMSGVATSKMRIARVKTELNRYANAIENYKLEAGEYPPDNGRMSTVSSNNYQLYHEYAALNPLFYELSGAVFTNNQFAVVSESEVVTINDLDKVFRRRGIRNSARVKNDIDFKGFTFKEAQFAELDPQIYSVVDVDVMSVPVPGPFNLQGKEVKKINPWFYDASSTNRHNKNSFDLWAEILVGGKTNIIGNWK